MRKLTLGILCVVLTVSVCGDVQAQENRFVVFSHGKHGYIDRDGKLVIPISLEGTYVLHFSEGLVSYSERVKPEPTELPYADQKGKLRLRPQKNGDSLILVERLLSTHNSMESGIFRRSGCRRPSTLMKHGTIVSIVASTNCGDLSTKLARLWSSPNTVLFHRSRKGWQR
jgi:hypothetical protein